MLIEGLHREGTTAMFALERPGGGRAAGDIVSEEYIADTIVRLGIEPVNRRAQRSLEVVKSRGQDYLMGGHSFRIVDRQGLEVYRRVQVPRGSRRVDSAALGDLTARITTGVRGTRRGPQRRLFRRQHDPVVGISGTGKSVMGLQFIAEGARRGERSLMVTLDEPRPRSSGTPRPSGSTSSPRSSGAWLAVWSRLAPGDGDRCAFRPARGDRRGFRPQRVVIDSLSRYGHGQPRRRSSGTSSLPSWG